MAHDRERLSSFDLHPLALAQHVHAKIDPFLWGLLPDNEMVLDQGAKKFHVSARNALASSAPSGRTARARYAIERFLYRLGRSKHRDRFALKGAILFTLWTGQTHRPTKDLDLLGRGLSSTIAEVEAMIRDICHIRQDDGIVFDRESIEGTRIKEEDEYDGIRWSTSLTMAMDEPSVGGRADIPSHSFRSSELSQPI